MRILKREQLREFLTVDWDPDLQNQEEMNFFADKILTDSQFAWFLVSDSENGADPEIHYPYSRTRKDLGQGSCEGGYYGIDLVQPEPYSPKLYNCYLGGSTGNSAPGFVVTEVDHE
jgi:hypothetical protein